MEKKSGMVLCHTFSTSPQKHSISPYLTFQLWGFFLSYFFYFSLVSLLSQLSFPFFFVCIFKSILETLVALFSDLPWVSANCCCCQWIKWLSHPSVSLAFSLWGGKAKAIMNKSSDHNKGPKQKHWDLTSKHMLEPREVTASRAHTKGPQSILNLSSWLTTSEANTSDTTGLVVGRRERKGSSDQMTLSLPPQMSLSELSSRNQQMKMKAGISELCKAEGKQSSSECKGGKTEDVAHQNSPSTPKYSFTLICAHIYLRQAI